MRRRFWPDCGYLDTVGAATRRGRVEEWRGDLGPCGHRSVSTPRSSNRTCGFPASGSPTDFISWPTACVTRRVFVSTQHQARRRRSRTRTVGSRATGPCDAVRLRLEIELLLKAPDLLRCFQAHRQSPSARPRLPPKRAGSQVPSLRRHYPASAVVRTCPTPVRPPPVVAFGVANPARPGLPR